eukprot:902233-Amphidinium_carterae.1
MLILDADLAIAYGYVPQVNGNWSMQEMAGLWLQNNHFWCGRGHVENCTQYTLTMAPAFQAGVRNQEFQAGWNGQCSNPAGMLRPHRHTDWHAMLGKRASQPLKKGALTALFWVINANAWGTFREQLQVALADTPVKPVICLQEHRLHGRKFHAAGQEARAQGWNWFAKEATKTGPAEQATSGGVALLTPLHRQAIAIPACEEDLASRTVAVQVQTGQQPVAICCLYAQVDPTP